MGIIGIGSQGKFYAEFIAKGKVDNIELAALSSPSLEKKHTYEKLYPTIPYYRNYLDLLESSFIDAVIICTPHYLHPEIAIAAIKRDTHVLIEKPAGVQGSKVKELNEAAQSKPTLSFGLIFNQRMNTLYQKVKELIDRGEIGNI